MDRYLGRRDITEILLKMALNNIQSIDQHNHEKSCTNDI